MRAADDKITLMNRGVAENKRSVTQVLSFRIQTYAIYGAAETNLLTTGCCHSNSKETGNGENTKIYTSKVFITAARW
jgi:hypothetical protein